MKILSSLLLSSVLFFGLTSGSELENFAVNPLSPEAELLLLEEILGFKHGEIDLSEAGAAPTEEGGFYCLGCLKDIAWTHGDSSHEISFEKHLAQCLGAFSSHNEPKKLVEKTQLRSPDASTREGSSRGHSSGDAESPITSVCEPSARHENVASTPIVLALGASTLLARREKKKKEELNKLALTLNLFSISN